MRGRRLLQGPLPRKGRLGGRQRDPDDRAGAVGPVAGCDVAAMRLDKTAADRQTETGAGAAPVLRLRAVEFVEHTLPLGRRYSGTFIGYLDHHFVPLRAGLQRDAARVRRVFSRVVEQVE